MEPTAVEIHEHIITVANLFFGGLALVFLLAIIPFLILCLGRGHTEIWGKGYDTVSSYCANQNGFGFRFLMFTTFVGWLTAALLIDEYQSKSQAFDKRIWVEITSSLLFPLVGFFYTNGKGRIEHLDCGIRKVPIAVSIPFHYIGALYFMLGNAIVNLTYAIDIQSDSHAAISVLALSIISLAFIAVFIAAQAVLHFKCAVRRFCNCYANFEEPQAEDYDPIGDEEPLPRRLETPDCVNNDLLCAVSFISEFLAFICVATLTALSSMKRNNHVTWIK